jgi:hypothetical protein
MKQIAALLLAAVALATFTAPSAGGRWGWDDLGASSWAPAPEEWAPLGTIGASVANGATTVEVVPVEIDDAATRAPGVLAVAMPQIEEAVEAIRAIVAQDPVLLGTLHARGLGPDDVVGLSGGRDGAVTLFVSTAA